MNSVFRHLPRLSHLVILNAAKSGPCGYAQSSPQLKYTLRNFGTTSVRKLNNCVVQSARCKITLIRGCFKDARLNLRLFHVSSPKRAPNPLALWILPNILVVTTAIIGHRLYLARRGTGAEADVARVRLMRLAVVFLVPIALCILFFYFTHIETAPITHRRRFMAFKNEDMVEMTSFETRLIDLEFSRFYLNTSDPVFKRVRKVVAQILDRNQDMRQVRDRDWSLVVINMPDIKNAFILPNGNMYIFTGILNICKNDDEVGFVVAHELSHAILEHLAEQISHMYMGEFLFLFPAFVIWSFLPTLGALAAHIFARYFADAIFNLPFSRYSEIEADMIGIQLASKACFDPRQAMLFWKKMMVTTAQGTPWRYKIEWLSTHPSYMTRARYLEKLMPMALQLRNEHNCPPLNATPGTTEVEYGHIV